MELFGNCSNFAWWSHLHVLRPNFADEAASQTPSPLILTNRPASEPLNWLSHSSLSARPPLPPSPSPLPRPNPPSPSIWTTTERNSVCGFGSELGHTLMMRGHKARTGWSKEKLKSWLPARLLLLVISLLLCSSNLLVRYSRLHNASCFISTAIIAVSDYNVT